MVAYRSLRVEEGTKKRAEEFPCVKESNQTHSSQGVFSKMSIQFSQAKLKGEERRAILQAIETQMQEVIIDGVTQVLLSFFTNIWPCSRNIWLFHRYLAGQKVIQINVGDTSHNFKCRKRIYSR
jgi:hypothetical protein